MTIRLRPCEVRDYEWMYRLVASDRALNTYRFRGQLPNPDRLRDALFEGVHLQVIVEVETGAASRIDPVGIVTSYRPDFRNQTARLATVFEPAARRFVLPALTRFLWHLFSEYAFRQVYVEGFKDALGPLVESNIGLLLESQGALEEAEFHRGQWVDVLMYRLTRSRFVRAVEEDERMAGWTSLPFGFASNRTDSNSQAPSSAAAAVSNGTGNQRANVQARQPAVSGAGARTIVEAALQRTSGVFDADPAAHLAELGVDSLTLVELISEIEEHTLATIPDTDLDRINTVGDLVAAVERLSASN